MGLKIEQHLNPIDELLLYCDPKYKPFFFDNLRKKLIDFHYLKGEALESCLINLKFQLENYQQDPKTKMSLDKIIQITFSHKSALKHNEYGAIVAGKINELFIETHSNKTFDYFNPFRNKVEKLQKELTNSLTKKELNDFFCEGDSADLSPCVIQALKSLSPQIVYDYAQENIFHMSEYPNLIPIRLKKLLDNLSDIQLEALTHGIADMHDKSKAFRQLFFMLHNVSSTQAPRLASCFPIREFLDYFIENQNKIVPYRIGFKKEFEIFELDGAVISGRLNRMAQITILEAVDTGNYVRANHILKFMQSKLLLEEIICDILCGYDVVTFRQNSSIGIPLKGMPYYL